MVKSRTLSSTKKMPEALWSDGPVSAEGRERDSSSCIGYLVPIHVVIPYRWTAKHAESLTSLIPSVSSITGCFSGCCCCSRFCAIPNFLVESPVAPDSLDSFMMGDDRRCAVALIGCNETACRIAYTLLWSGSVCRHCRYRGRV